MHRELKRETPRPRASTLRSQQRRFDFFREEPPHEGIGDRIPASLWGRTFAARHPCLGGGLRGTNRYETRASDRHERGLEPS
jgi:hypothetical protein